MFRFCETKQFRQKIVIPLPLLWMKNLHTRVFSFFFKHRVAFWKLLLLWRKIQPKIVISPSYAENFPILKTFWNTERVPWDFFRYRETKNLLEIVLPAPFFYPQRFSIPETSDTLKGSWTKNFSTVRWKFFDGETLYSLPPQAHLLIHKIFRQQKFLNHRRVPLRNFLVLWGKKFSQRILISDSHA